MLSGFSTPAFKNYSFSPVDPKGSTFRFQRSSLSLSVSFRAIGASFPRGRRRKIRSSGSRRLPFLLLPSAVLFRISPTFLLILEVTRVFCQVFERHDLWNVDLFGCWTADFGACLWFCWWVCFDSRFASGSFELAVLGDFSWFKRSVKAQNFLVLDRELRSEVKWVSRSFAWGVSEWKFENAEAIICWLRLAVHEMYEHNWLRMVSSGGHKLWPFFRTGAVGCRLICVFIWLSYLGYWSWGA